MFYIDYSTKSGGEKGEQKILLTKKGECVSEKRNVIIKSKVEFTLKLQSRIANILSENG